MCVFQKESCIFVWQYKSCNCKTQQCKINITIRKVHPFSKLQFFIKNPMLTPYSKVKLRIVQLRTISQTLICRSFTAGFFFFGLLSFLFIYLCFIYLFLLLFLWVKKKSRRRDMLVKREKKKIERKIKSELSGIVCHKVKRFINIKITIVLVHKKFSQNFSQQLKCQIFYMLKEN